MGGGIADPINNIFDQNACWGSNVEMWRGMASPVITDNFHGGDPGGSPGVFRLGPFSGTETVTGNDVWPGTYAPSSQAAYAAAWPTNTWNTSAPSGTWTLVRPNLYTTGRGHVAIYNWDAASSINVNCSSFLNNGETYAVYHAMDPRGTPAATGTFGGTTISFPMTGLTVETPAGVAAPSVTTPYFAAFVVVKT